MKVATLGLGSAVALLVANAHASAQVPVYPAPGPVYPPPVVASPGVVVGGTIAVPGGAVSGAVVAPVGPVVAPPVVGIGIGGFYRPYYAPRPVYYPWHHGYYHHGYHYHR